MCVLLCLLATWPMVRLPMSVLHPNGADIDPPLHLMSAVVCVADMPQSISTKKHQGYLRWKCRTQLGTLSYYYRSDDDLDAPQGLSVAVMGSGSHPMATSSRSTHIVHGSSGANGATEQSSSGWM